MCTSLRFGSALSAIAAASMIGGCAVPQAGPRSASIFGGKVDKSNIGLATRALAALNANDFASAVNLAERAVENSPNDAGFRSLLGNAYFSAGRFASAEAAYRDSLTLISNQPQVVLKLALAQIAQGKNAEASSSLEGARGVLDVADYGLALALAGQPQNAVNVLEPAARQIGADARVRQNLALAHALSGDWTTARIIAGQDLPADLVDSRIQQWMTFAKPSRAADQVASLTGVTPAAVDPGQPTRLALRETNSRLAAAQPAPEAVASHPVETVAETPAPIYTAPAVEPAPAVVAEALSQPQPLAVAPESQRQPASAVIAAAAAPEAPSAYAAMISFSRPKPVRTTATKRQPVRNAVLVRATGKSSAVVQLGAYGSPQRVVAAWSEASRRFSALRPYAPMSARFDSPRGTVYRLSLKGFNSDREARLLCESLRKSGGSCFVRNVAGDAPVQLASR